MKQQSFTTIGALSPAKGTMFVMTKKIALIILNSFIILLSATTTTFAGVIHSNISNQELSLADLSGRSYPNIGVENFWIIGAMIAMAIVFVLIDKAKEKKAQKKDLLSE